MNYTMDEFAALHAEIEEQGGALLPDACLPQDIIFEAPPYNRAHTEKKVTCFCNNESRFVSPYEGEPPKKGAPLPRRKKAHFITACAVCDAVGDWPRYRDVVLAAEDGDDS